MEPPGKPAPEGDKNTPLSQAVSASGEFSCIVLQAIPTAGRGARLPFDVREYCHYIVYSRICQHHILWKTGGKPNWHTWRNAESARLACVLHALPTTLSTDKLFSPRILHAGKPAFPPSPAGKNARPSKRETGVFRQLCHVQAPSFHGFPTSAHVSFPPVLKGFRAFPHSRKVGTVQKMWKAAPLEMQGLQNC